MATGFARKPVTALGRPENVAQLLRRLGNIPAFRVRLEPPIGTATEKDLVRHNESKLKTAICELVDGTLVEKAMGWIESAIAIKIAASLSNFVTTRKLGTVLGADGMLRLVPGLVRVPDVSYFARGKLTRSRYGASPVAPLVGDLVVEVVSKSNTKARDRAEDRRVLRSRQPAGLGRRTQVSDRAGTHGARGVRRFRRQ